MIFFGYLILGIWNLISDTWNLYLRSCDWYPILDILYLIPYTWYLIFNISYLTFDAWYTILDLLYLISHTWYMKLDIWYLIYLIFGNFYFIHNNWYLILDTGYSILVIWSLLLLTKRIDSFNSCIFYPPAIVVACHMVHIIQIMSNNFNLISYSPPNTDTDTQLFTPWLTQPNHNLTTTSTAAHLKLGVIQSCSTPTTTTSSPQTHKRLLIDNCLHNIKRPLTITKKQ